MVKRSVCDEGLGLQVKAQHVGGAALAPQTELGDLGRVINEAVPGRHGGSRSVEHAQGWQNTCHIPFKQNSVAGESIVTGEHMCHTSVLTSGKQEWCGGGLSVLRMILIDTRKQNRDRWRKTVSSIHVNVMTRRLPGISHYICQISHLQRKYNWLVFLILSVIMSKLAS